MVKQLYLGITKRSDMITKETRLGEIRILLDGRLEVQVLKCIVEDGEPFPDPQPHRFVITPIHRFVVTSIIREGTAEETVEETVSERPTTETDVQDILDAVNINLVEMGYGEITKETSDRIKNLATVLF